MTPSIPLVDLKAAYRRLQAEIDAATARVLAGGWYILGPEVSAFEAEFAAYLGVEHAVGVASGTDAVLLALRALGVGPGDEVITVAHLSLIHIWLKPVREVVLPPATRFSAFGVAAGGLIRRLWPAWANADSIRCAARSVSRTGRRAMPPALSLIHI